MSAVIRALLVHVAAADADGADQLVLHDDRQAAADEVVGEAGLLAEVECESAGPSTSLKRCATALDGVRA